MIVSFSLSLSFLHADGTARHGRNLPILLNLRLYAILTSDLRGNDDFR